MNSLIEHLIRINSIQNIKHNINLLLNDIPQKPLTKYLFKIMLVGPSGVGKTSIIKRFVRDVFNDTTSDIPGLPGDGFLNKEITIGSNKVTLQIWEYNPEKNEDQLKLTSGFIIVYDVTKPETFTESQSFIKNINTTAPMFLVGNKNDLITIDTKKIPIPLWNEPGKKGAIDHYTYNHYLTSAKTNYNINIVFESITKRMLERLKLDS